MGVWAIEVLLILIDFSSGNILKFQCHVGILKQSKWHIEHCHRILSEQQRHCETASEKTSCKKVTFCFSMKINGTIVGIK